jgi:membrane-bound metal-dependent hydrolase YbcI (DUF457 family)
MFVGHIALAYAAKRVRPDASLGWFYAAVAGLDLVWPILLLAGIETVDLATKGTEFTGITFTSYPWSHSLVMAVVWGIVLAGIARGFGVARATCGWLAALVVSHWVLDFVTHAPDMPLWPGSAKYGLALWNSVVGTYVVEGAMWIGALALYLSARRPVGAKGWIAFLSFTIVSTMLWIPGPFTPPPTSVTLLGVMALIGGWFSIPWIAWGDRNTRAA